MARPDPDSVLFLLPFGLDTEFAWINKRNMHLSLFLEKPVKKKQENS